MEYMGSSYFSLKNQVIKAERRILKVSLYMKIDLPNHKTPLKFWLFQKVVQQILAIFLHDMIRMVFFFLYQKGLIKVSSTIISDVFLMASCWLCTVLQCWNFYYLLLFELFEILLKWDHNLTALLFTM